MITSETTSEEVNSKLGDLIEHECKSINTNVDQKAENKKERRKTERSKDLSTLDVLVLIDVGLMHCNLTIITIRSRGILDIAQTVFIEYGRCEVY